MPAREDAAVASVDLLARLAADDPEAAALVFERYAARLTRLAQARLSRRLAARIDADDVMMSAFRSFFRGAKKGQFEISRGGDLWRLLVEITLHKLFRTASHHRALKRSVDREQPLSAKMGEMVSSGCEQPTPLEEVAAADELDAVLEDLSDRAREAVELRMVGWEIEEIAERMQCSGRTVRRHLHDARQNMTARAGSEFVLSAARRSARQFWAAEKRDATGRLPEATLAWKDYLLREQIGAGSTGRVYRALRRSDAREVAIKFLRKSLTKCVRNVERFAREAAMVAGLRHPGIVGMEGIGQTPGGGLFLVMDLVMGHNLAEMAARRPSAWKAVQWVAEAAIAVDYAHAAGVIHCDLKPSNLLVDDSDRVRVTDFGLAVPLQDTSGALLAGTPAFMAPEQVDSRWGPISPRTDVWGLGSVLYFLLFGKPPHCGASVAEVLSAAADSEAIPIPELPGGPQAIGSVVARCLQKQPANRYRSPAELADALRFAISAGAGES